MHLPAAARRIHFGRVYLDLEIVFACICILRFFVWPSPLWLNVKPHNIEASMFVFALPWLMTQCSVLDCSHAHSLTHTQTEIVWVSTSVAIWFDFYYCLFMTKDISGLMINYLLFIVTLVLCLCIHRSEQKAEAAAMHTICCPHTHTKWRRNERVDWVAFQMGNRCLVSSLFLLLLHFIDMIVPTVCLFTFV